MKAFSILQELACLVRSSACSPHWRSWLILERTLALSPQGSGVGKGERDPLHVLCVHPGVVHSYPNTMHSLNSDDLKIFQGLTPHIDWACSADSQNDGNEDLLVTFDFAGQLVEQLLKHERQVEWVYELSLKLLLLGKQGKAKSWRLPQLPMLTTEPKVMCHWTKLWTSLPCPCSMQNWPTQWHLLWKSQMLLLVSFKNTFQL